MKSLLLILFILVFTLVGFGQEVEYGKPSELKGLTKLFINTEDDVLNGGRIAKIISDKLPAIQIVSSQKDAEIVVFFVGTYVAKSYGKTSAGNGFVAIKGADPKTPRILLTYEGEKTTYLESKPANKFADLFVKEYKKANQKK